MQLSETLGDFKHDGLDMDTNPQRDPTYTNTHFGPHSRCSSQGQFHPGAEEKAAGDIGFPKQKQWCPGK